jgi:lipopolysaccharide/colanic/teichoic acid biosynthesis glycosyltransferase
MGGGIVIMSVKEASRNSNVTCQYRTYDVVKRVMDMTIVLLAFIFLAPLWVLIAIAIRLTSPGSIFFVQPRVIGKDGREFSLYKFRTMYHNADNCLHKQYVDQFLKGQPMSHIEKNGDRIPVYKFINDPRITPFGKILRKTGLDEAAQFINVLRGEMSLVGPRPPVFYEFEQYNEKCKHRVDVLPGITGLYQVTARSQVPFEEMLKIDLNYILHRSIWLDLKIIFLTPWVMLMGKGAH